MLIAACTVRLTANVHSVSLCFVASSLRPRRVALLLGLRCGHQQKRQSPIRHTFRPSCPLTATLNTSAAILIADCQNFRTGHSTTPFGAAQNETERNIMHRRGPFVTVL